MRDKDVLTGALLEEACLTADELASACSVTTEWIVRHVEEGALASEGASAAEWRFTCRDVWRVQHIYRLERDFGAEPELAALIADLLEEIERLRARLRRAGLD
jgi:chaperone modulatory protein CbpM